MKFMLKGLLIWWLETYMKILNEPSVIAKKISICPWKAVHIRRW